MTVFFFLTMLAILVVIDGIIERRKAKRVGQHSLQRSPAGSFEFRLPADVALATNHTWLRKSPDGTVTVGFDEFLGNLIGAPERVSLPFRGNLITTTDGHFQLYDGDRRLEFVSPVAGQVVEVNVAAEANPSLITQDPYGRGWLFRVRPMSTGDLRHPPMTGETAVRWLKRQARLAVEFLSLRQVPAAVVTMYDGGEPRKGVLRQFDAEVWREFQDKFIGRFGEERKGGEE